MALIDISKIIDTIREISEHQSKELANAIREGFIEGAKIISDKMEELQQKEDSGD